MDRKYIAYAKSIFFICKGGLYFSLWMGLGFVLFLIYTIIATRTIVDTETPLAILEGMASGIDFKGHGSKGMVILAPVLAPLIAILIFFIPAMTFALTNIAFVNFLLISTFFLAVYFVLAFRYGLKVFLKGNRLDKMKSQYQQRVDFHLEQYLKPIYNAEKSDRRSSEVLATLSAINRDDLLTSFQKKITKKGLNKMEIVDKPRIANLTTELSLQKEKFSKKVIILMKPGKKFLYIAYVLHFISFVIILTNY